MESTMSFARPNLNIVSRLELASDLYPTFLVNSFLANSFEYDVEYDVEKHVLVYKKAANKIRPVPTTMPDYAKVRRRFQKAHC